MSGYAKKLQGHILLGAGWSGLTARAVCECGATSISLQTVAARRQWHREHKAAVVDGAAERASAEAIAAHFHDEAA